jgi:hypothetical protein
MSEYSKRYIVFYISTMRFETGEKHDREKEEKPNLRLAEGEEEGELAEGERWKL